MEKYIQTLYAIPSVWHCFFLTLYIRYTTVKKVKQVNIRADPEELASFRDACKAHGVKASVVIRDLCAAAIPYMGEHCPANRWITPRLVPFGAVTAAEVLQVHNGKGHQVVRMKKGKK